MSEVHTLITEVSVCALPPDHPDWPLYVVQVAWRGLSSKGVSRYGVFWAGRRLSRRGTWEWEPLPSGRISSWTRRFNFSYDEALERAIKVAPTIIATAETQDGES